MSGNLCRCGAYANIVAAIRGRGRDAGRAVRPFAYDRAADAGRRRAPRRRPERRSWPAAPTWST